MKCPKCGYNSFESLDSCKKCGTALASFKKSHRIRPVMFRSGAATGAAASPESSPDRLTAVAAAPVDTLAPETDEEFSWEAPGDSPAPQPAESPYTGFNLDFVDLPPVEAKDGELGGFSFDEPAPEPAPAPPEMPAEEFSFDEPADTETASFTWDTPADEAEGEMDKYQRMLEPGSMGEAAVPDGDGVTGEKDYSGTMDFSFAPEQAAEDIFREGEVTATPKPSEKSGQPDLENFDKEFEMIFSLEDKDDSGDKNAH